MVYPHIQYLGPAHSDGPQSPDVAASRPHSPEAASVRELDSRVNDGIRVRLLWHAADGHVSVAVRDTKTGEAFELPVGEGQRALDVYHHPYAYAAGSPVRAARPPRLSARSAVSS